MTVSFLQMLGDGENSPTLTVPSPSVGNCRTTAVTASDIPCVEQLTLDDALAAAERGMTLAIDKAQRTDPAFSERACTAILAHLRAAGPTSGELLTDIAKAHGARPENDRAFGAVYKGLLKRGQIVVVGYAPRLKGHGCIGAKVYALAH